MIFYFRSFILTIIFMNNYIKLSYKYPTANKHPKHQLPKKGPLSSFLRKFQGKIYQMDRQGTLRIVNYNDKENIAENCWKGDANDKIKGEVLKKKSKSLNIARPKIKTQNDNDQKRVQESHQLNRSYLSYQIFKSGHKNITFQQNQGKKHDSDPIRNFNGNPKCKKNAEITPFFLPIIHTKQRIEQHNNTGEFGGGIGNDNERRKINKQQLHPKNRKHLHKGQKISDIAQKNKVQKML